MKLFLVVCLFVVVGCNVSVPVGHVGMVKEPGGLNGSVLQPGLRSCFGRDQMTLIQTSESVFKESMQIRCADKLNTKSFNLVLRVAPKISNGADYIRIMKEQGAKMVGTVITADILYEVYVKQTARNIARLVVSKYNSDELVENRAVIQAGINKGLRTALEGTPVVLKAALVNNLDPPDVITDAISAAKKRELEISKEKASQAIKLLQAKNRMAVAEQEKLTLAKEAEAEAAYMLIIGKSLTPEFLERRRLKVQELRIAAELEAYKRVGEGDKIIMTGGANVTPLISLK